MFTEVVFYQGEHLLLAHQMERELRFAIFLPVDTVPDVVIPMDLTQARHLLLKNPSGLEGGLTWNLFNTYVFHEGKNYTGLGVSRFSLDDLMGYDELVNYTIIDFLYDNQGMLPWRSRFPRTAREKVDFSARYRAQVQAQLAASLYVPFFKGSFEGCTLHLVERGKLDFNGVINHSFDGEAQPVGENGRLFKDHFFRADLTQNGEYVDLQLAWNKDGSPCREVATFTLESDAGYLPKTKVTTDSEGKARFKVMPLGLDTGDLIKVKVNCTHYSNIGSIEIVVP